MDFLQNSKCEEFLNSIPQPKLLPLAESIKKLKLPPAEDAVTYILKYTKTPKELLERQLIKKDYLKDYLLENMKAFPKGAKKEELIEIILDMWKPSIFSNMMGTSPSSFPPDDSPPEKKPKVSRQGTQLNKDDKAKCKGLLTVIPENELFSMAETLTKLKYTSKKDAIKDILMFTKTPKDLLEKKSIQKNFLTLYILQKKKPCPANANKKELVEIILNMWSADIKPSSVDPNASGASGVTPIPSSVIQTQGMNQKEKSNCKELLKLMPQADLLPLANTISKTECKNASEAIPAILLYTKSQKELLEKPKMKREMLELYLIRKGTLPPASARKHDLVEEILKLWNPSQ